MLPRSSRHRCLFTHIKRIPLNRRFLPGAAALASRCDKGSSFPELSRFFPDASGQSKRIVAGGRGDGHTRRSVIDITFAFGVFGGSVSMFVVSSFGSVKRESTLRGGNEF